MGCESCPGCGEGKEDKKCCPKCGGELDDKCCCSKCNECSDCCKCE